MSIVAKRIKLNILFNKCQFKQLMNQKKYTSLVRLICNKQFILNIQSFFNYLNSNYSWIIGKTIKTDIKSIKKIVTLFLILNFKEMIFTNKTEYEQPLIIKSKSIYDLLKKLDNKKSLLYYLKLIIAISKFNSQYNLWAILDKRINTYQLLKLYYENTDYINNLNKEIHNYTIILNGIKKDQQNIINSIKFMNDSNEINFFEHHKNNLKYRDTIDKNLYFIEVKAKFCQEPPDKLVFIDLVKKTQKLLKMCVPNKKDIHNQIDESLDCDLIEVYIKNNVDYHDHLVNVLNVILDHIKSFQCKADDESLEEFRIKINRDIKMVHYKICLPKFFMDVFDKINNIIESRNTFLSMNK